jgi:hypothetical protein
MKSLRLKLRFTTVPRSPTPTVHIDRVVLLGIGNSTGDLDALPLLFYIEGDRDACTAVLTLGLQIEDYEIMPGSEDGFYLYVHARIREQYKPLVEAFERERIVVLPPIEFRSDRTMRLTIIGESDELQSVIDELPAEMDVDVLRIGRYADVFNSGLTDRQQEALSAAWTIGYYSVPREGDLETVADELGCATSTASDLLRRAEAQLVSDALGKGP